MKKYFLFLSMFIYQTLYTQPPEDSFVELNELSVGDTLVAFTKVKLHNSISGYKRKSEPFEKFRVIEIEPYQAVFVTIKSYEEAKCKRIYISDESERVYILEKKKIKGFMRFKSII